LGRTFGNWYVHNESQIEEVKQTHNSPIKSKVSPNPKPCLILQTKENAFALIEVGMMESFFLNHT